MLCASNVASGLLFPLPSTVHDTHGAPRSNYDCIAELAFSKRTAMPYRADAAADRVPTERRGGGAMA
jgi:hypothetical protein